MKPNVSHPSELARVLGPVAAIAIVVGTVIGSGVFKKPQIIAEKVPFTGPTAILWILGGLLTLLGALAYAEVAVLYPRAGGNFVFLREAYGRLPSFLYGWIEFLVIRAGSIAALATVFTESFHELFRDPGLQGALGMEPGSELGFWPQRLLTIATLGVLTLVNARGTRWGGGLQVFLTLVKVASLLAIVALPFLFFMKPSPGGVQASRANLNPVWPQPWSTALLSGVGTAFLGVLWAFHGWMSITPVAEEVRRPQRNLPLALLGGVGILTALYLGANLAYNLVIPQADMAILKDRTVAAEFGRRLFGSAGAALAAAAVMISVFGALNGNLLAGPRVLYAMGEDRLAPRALAAVHTRFGTPAVAIVVLGIWSALLVLVVAILTQMNLLEPNKSHFDRLTDFAMFAAVLFETMAVLSIFVFRRRRPDAERPYRCLGYPVVPALYVVLPAFILVNTLIMEPVEALAALGFTAAGGLVYFVFRLNRSNQ
jgi:amino acid transporter